MRSRSSSTQALSSRSNASSLCQRWVLASIAGALLNSMIIELVIVALPQLTSEATEVQYVPLAFYFGSFFVTTSLLQWWVLRRYLQHSAWWIVANAGGAIGLLLTAYGAHMLGGQEGTALVVLFGIGGVMGVAQWVVLRLHVPLAGWWILCSAGAWPIAFVGVGSFIFQLGFLKVGLIATVVGIIQQIMIWTLYNMITGLVLAKLWEELMARIDRTTWH